MAGFGGALYVGDLHPSVTEADIFQAFSKAGQVASVRVCRDAGTRRSLGYAYVNYHDAGDADKALHLLHGTEIRWRNNSGQDQPGRHCRVMWSQRDPALRKSNVGNIHIKNLPANVDNKRLIDYFSKWGNILSCKVVTDKEGKSLGYGFVHYEAEANALKAIQNANEKPFEHDRDGKPLLVSKFVPRKNREKKTDAKNFVFVRSIRGGTTEDELKTLFAPFDVDRVEIKKPALDKLLTYTVVEGNEPRTCKVQSTSNPEVVYAFVYCSSADKARAALSMHSSLFKQVRLDVLPPRESKTNTLYVGCLPRGSSEASVRQIFQQFSPSKVELRPYSPGAVIRTKNDKQEFVEIVIGDDAPIVEAEVTFETPTDLDKALKLSPVVNHLYLVIDHAPQNNKLYIGSIAAETTEDELREHIQKFARVKEIRIAECRPGASIFFLKAADGKAPTPVLLPNGQGAPVKHGCITVESTAELIQAKKGLDKQEYRGYVLIVRPHVSSKQREKEKEQKKKERYELYLASNLYVNNLPENFTQVDIERVFGQHGKVVQIRLNTDNNGRFKGGAFVRFESPAGAANAMEALNNKSFDGARTVVVQPYLRREDRRRREPASRADRGNQMQQFPFGRQGMVPPGPQFRPPMMPRPAGPWPMPPMPYGFMMTPQGPPKFALKPAVGPGYPVDPRQQMRAGPPPQRGRPNNAARPGPPGGRRRVDLPPQGEELLMQIANLAPDDQKQQLGSRLFVKIRPIDPERAGKITGMLLEMDQREIVRLLLENDALIDKVNEAAAVLAQTTGRS